MTPTLLNNRYRIVRVLASGGFGDTFLAEDSFLPSNRLCVIKQLKLLTDNPQVYAIVQERFRREAAILEELGRASEQIPELYAYFEESDRFYLVQEWIEGQTLGQKVRTEGIMSELAVKQLLEKTLPALSYIHRRGIIHRDIKPDNIILRHRDSLPILIDFGAVKESVGTVLNSQGQTTSSIVIGTPGYMPPEQGVGRPVFSSDLYSLGLTAVYILTGKLPQDLPTNHRTGEFSWRSFAPTVSDRLANILDRMIQYHPRDRFATSEELQEILQAPNTLRPVAMPVVSPVTFASTTAPPPTAVSQPPSASPSLPPTRAHSFASIPSVPPTSLPSIPPASRPPVAVSPTSPHSLPPNSLPPNSLPPDSLPPNSLPPTQVHSIPAESASRSLIAAGITATLVAFAGGGSYFYYSQQVQPYREAQAMLEQIESLHVRGDHRGCISKAETFPAQFPDLRDRVEAILADCASARDKETLQQAVNIASEDDPDWDEAITKAKTIPASSPIYKDTEPFIFKWQANALQDYLRIDVPASNLKVASTLPSYELVVEQVNSEQVVISYDAAPNSNLTQPETIKTITALLMELLQGNGTNIPPRYTDFNQLVIYPRQSDRQGTLQTKDWQTYIQGKASENDLSELQKQLLAQVKVTNR